MNLKQEKYTYCIFPTIFYANLVVRMTNMLQVNITKIKHWAATITTGTFNGIIVAFDNVTFAPADIRMYV